MSQRGASLLEAAMATALSGMIAAGALLETRSAAQALGVARRRSAMLTVARNVIEKAVALPCIAAIECPTNLRCRLSRARVAGATPAGASWRERLEVRVEARSNARPVATTLATAIERIDRCADRP